jgi:hypothetical protein
MGRLRMWRLIRCVVVPVLTALSGRFAHRQHGGREVEIIGMNSRALCGAKRGLSTWNTKDAAAVFNSTSNGGAVSIGVFGHDRLSDIQKWSEMKRRNALAPCFVGWRKEGKGCL